MNELLQLVKKYRARATRCRVRAIERSNPALYEIAQEYDLNAEAVERLLGDKHVEITTESSAG